MVWCRTGDKPLPVPMLTQFTDAYIYIYIYIYICATSLNVMVTSSNETIFRVTSPLGGTSTGHRWITLTKANDAALWCSLWCSLRLYKRLSKRSKHRWFKTPSHPKLRHCNGVHVWCTCISGMSEVSSLFLLTLSGTYKKNIILIYVSLAFHEFAWDLCMDRIFHS